MLSHFKYGLAITVSAAALAFPALADTPTIDTYTGWNKSDSIAAFGCPDTSTYGQIITVPTGLHHLSQFTFWMKNFNGTNSMVVRAHVYRWDAVNSKVQGASLYESLPRTIAFADSNFHGENFVPPNIAVTPGVQYVIFASIDWEYVDCTNSYQLAWGANPNDPYSGGAFVFNNDTGNDLKWSTAWSGLSNYDLALKAYLNP
jgi:hypothetical protein